MHVVSKENVTRVVLCMDIPYVCDTRHGGDGRMHLGIWMAIEEVLKLREKKVPRLFGTRSLVVQILHLVPSSPATLHPQPPLQLPPSPALSTALATTLLELPLPLPPFPSLLPVACSLLTADLFILPPPRDETRGIPLAGQKAAVSRIAARRHPRRTPRGLCKLWTPSTSTAR